MAMFTFSPIGSRSSDGMRMCVCVRACVCACVRACVRACVHACMCMDGMKLEVCTMLAYQHISSFHIHMHMHTRILKQFEDSEPTGAKSGYCQHYGWWLKGMLSLPMSINCVKRRVIITYGLIVKDMLSVSITWLLRAHVTWLLHACYLTVADLKIWH